MREKKKKGRGGEARASWRILCCELTTPGKKGAEKKKKKKRGGGGTRLLENFVLGQHAFSNNNNKKTMSFLHLFIYSHFGGAALRPVRVALLAFLVAVVHFCAPVALQRFFESFLAAKGTLAHPAQRETGGGRG